MRAYLIAHAIAATVQCVLVWLVVSVTNRRLDRQWEEALLQWKATDRNATGSVDEMMELLSRR